MNPDNLEYSHQAEPTHIVPAETSRPVMTLLTKKLFGVALLASSLVAIGFEQSPANESLRINQATDVLEDGGDAIDVGMKVATITMAIELGSSALIVAGLNQKGGVMNSKLEASRERKLRRNAARQARKLTKGQKDTELTDPIDPEQQILPVDQTETSPELLTKEQDRRKNKIAKAASSTLAYAGIALGVGAGIVVVDKKRESKKPTVSRDVGHAIAASTLVAGVCGTVGYLAAGGIEHLEDTPLEPGADFFVEHATDFKTWMLVLLPMFAYRTGRWLSDVRYERKEAELNKQALV